MRITDFRIITHNSGRSLPSSVLIGGTPNSRGFTLIETIITLVVLSIAAIGVLSVFTTGMKGSPNPLITNQAISLAQEKMDSIIGDKMNTTTPRGFTYIIPGNYPAESPVTGFPAFSRSVNVYCVTAGALDTNNGDVPPCTTSGYAHITVTVTNATVGNVNVDTVVTNY